MIVREIALPFRGGSRTTKLDVVFPLEIRWGLRPDGAERIEARAEFCKLRNDAFH